MPICKATSLWASLLYEHRAQNMKTVLIKQMAESEGVDEVLKEQNQMELPERNGES
ncbi:MAG: TnpV protein [Oscillospiraceae bacterium]|nr:TnpV protein [Oscillospiraceae bacterium]